jgi:hypothetical protein
MKDLSTGEQERLGRAEALDRLRAAAGADHHEEER